MIEAASFEEVTQIRMSRELGGKPVDLAKPSKMGVRDGRG
jgi:hypothetical protein